MSSITAKWTNTRQNSGLTIDTNGTLSGSLKSPTINLMYNAGNTFGYQYNQQFNAFLTSDQVKALRYVFTTNKYSGTSAMVCTSEDNAVEETINALIRQVNGN